MRGNIHNYRYSKSGELCTGIGGYMDYRHNPTRWSRCSVEDFQAYFSSVDKGNSICLGKILLILLLNIKKRNRKFCSIRISGSVFSLIGTVNDTVTSSTETNSPTSTLPPQTASSTNQSASTENPTTIRVTTIKGITILFFVTQTIFKTPCM